MLAEAQPLAARPHSYYGHPSVAQPRADSCRAEDSMPRDTSSGGSPGSLVYPADMGYRWHAIGYVPLKNQAVGIIWEDYWVATPVGLSLIHI